ncbi:4-alpha-glucanotransferase [Acholeplasma sp. OttesenSCG-928-E16]|nr:4-alpha-glucanotransferase [Acholeplasma sp. OttesenSCG-928-E16]
MRKTGILLHITSLPSKYGIGTLGKEAFHFVDQLNYSKQSYWQILPIGPTSYGDSPYQTFSAFAGNPYFIDLEILIEEKLLLKEEIDIFVSDDSVVDYYQQYQKRFLILKKAFFRFDIHNKNFQKFVKREKDWLFDYCLFMTIKNLNDGKSWIKWDHKQKIRDPKTIKKIIEENQEEIDFWHFVQFKFYEQWSNLRRYANKNKVKIIGDIPIYLALDSSDVWANPKMFDLNEELTPIYVAGVPPDGFSEFGQLWGNPLYDWKYMEKTNFSWWIKRIASSLKMFDIVRIDHFIGFDHYYKIPYCDSNAVNGHWVDGPGYKLFKAIKESLGKVAVIAENLGDVTERVKKLLKDCHFPGMVLSQFSFYGEEKKYLPCNYENNIIAYTGTHDNMTTKSWVETLNDYDKNFLLDYTHSNLDTVVDGLIKVTLSSNAKLTIIPLQDYMNLDDKARMNEPATIGNNWVFRVKKSDLNDQLFDKIKRFTILYNRN